MAKSKTITLTLKTPTKGTLVKIIVAAMLIAFSFCSGVAYQKHIDNNGQGTPMICNCPDVRVQNGNFNYPCC